MADRLGRRPHAVVLPGRVVIALLTVLASSVITHPAGAQCGRDGALNPCGPLPWSQLPLPALRSPTPYTPQPAVVITVTPTATATLTLTPGGTTPTADPGATIDPGLISTPAGMAQEAINTLAPLMDVQLVNPSGTPQGLVELAEEIGGQAGTFVGYARGLELLHLGTIGQIISWAILALGFVALVFVLTAGTPVLIWIANAVLKIVDLVLELIPF